jgi:hypothetical protein
VSGQATHWIGRLAVRHREIPNKDVAPFVSGRDPIVADQRDRCDRVTVPGKRVDDLGVGEVVHCDLGSNVLH